MAPTTVKSDELTSALPTGLPTRTMRPWVRWSFYLLMGLAMVLLVWGAYKGWDELAGYSFRMDWASLGASSLIYAPTILVTVWGWHAILRRFGGQISYRKNVKLYCSTNLARRLPTVLFYTAGRAYAYGRENISAPVVSMVVLLELVMVALSGLIVTTVLWPFVSGLPLPKAVPIVAVVGLVVLAVLFTAAHSPLYGLEKLSQRFFGASLLCIKRRDMAKWTGIYSLNWILGGTALFFLIRTFMNLSWSIWPNVVIIWSLSGLVSTVVTIFVPAGLGPREVTMAYLLRLIVPLPISIAIAALSRVWLAVNQLIWFLLSLLM